MRIRTLSATIAVLLLSALPAAAQEPDSTLSLDSLLNTVVSSASRYDQTIRQAPASVAVITSDDIERYGFQRLSDALASLAGFYSSYDLNYSYVGVRGFGRPTDYNNRILLLVNGQAINEPEYGSAPFGTEFPIPLSLIERIEVVRGPGSVLYGTGAMFAVVNVITKSEIDQTAIRAQAETGSMGRRSVTGLAQHRFSDGATVQVALTGTKVAGSDRYFAEYDSAGVSNGVARDLDGDNYSGAYLSFARRGLSINASVFKREKFIPTASWDAAFNHPDAWTTDDRASIDMEYRRGLNASTEAFFEFRFEHYDYKGSYPLATESYRDGSIANWGHAEAGLLWDIDNRNRLITGVDFVKVFRSDLRMYFDGTEGYNLDAPFNVGAVYAQLESRLTDRLSTVVGLSRDERSYGVGFTSPRASLLYSPHPNTTLKLLYGQAFRSPSPYEIYSESGWDGMTRAADLASERITTAEAVWEQLVGKRLALSTSVYSNDVHGLIDFVPVDGDADGGGYLNNSSVHGRGLEVTAHLREWRGRSAFVSLTYQKTEDGDSGQRLTNAPELLIKGGWQRQFTPRVSGGLLVQHESDRLTLNGTTTRPFTRVDGTLTANLSSRLSVSGALYNMFDADYAVPAGAEHRQNTLPQDGRTFVVRLDAQLR